MRSQIGEDRLIDITTCLYGYAGTFRQDCIISTDGSSYFVIMDCSPGPDFQAHTVAAVSRSPDQELEPVYQDSYHLTAKLIITALSLKGHNE